MNGCLSSPKRHSRTIADPKIVGQATNIIATKILKGSVENNKNFVFSPFGFSTILTILSEGAGTDTNNDITTVLKHPNNRQAVREAYRNSIEYFQGNNPEVVPQFRTWFYIYKNNTVDESYRNTLANDYYVTVKEIDRNLFYDLNKGEMSSESSPTSMTPLITKSETKESTLKATELTPQTTKVAENTTSNSKDVVDFDTLKAESAPVDEPRIDAQENASKFDEIVDDHQYVEVPEIKKEFESKSEDQALAIEKQNKTTAAPIETTTATIKVDEPEKFTLPLKHFDDMEIMQAQESRLGKRFGNDEAEGTSVISGNSIIGEKENAVESDADKYESKMMLFNGLYYRGNWATPFQVSNNSIPPVPPWGSSLLDGYYDLQMITNN